MRNDFGNRIPYSEYVEAFSQTRLPLKVPGAIPNLEPRDDIWPTDKAPVLRLADAGIGLVQMRWGFAPGRPEAGPVINFGRASLFARALPCSGIALLRFSRNEGAEIKVAVHQGR